MDRLHQVNPFSKRESFSRNHVLTYKILSLLSWLIVIGSNIYYTFHAPGEGIYKKRTIHGQSRAHPTAFTLNIIFVDIYWIVLWILQLGYIARIFSVDAEVVTSAANVGGHFIFFNLLSFGHVMLWVRSHFWWAELLLIINFFNLTFLYLRHPKCHNLVHVAVVSAPLAWVFMAIFWNGAVMVDANSLAARILANIVIWGILGFGAFFLLAFKDFTIGFELSFLTAGLGVAQFFTKLFALQWIFAFTIMGLLFVFSVAVAIPGTFGFRTAVEPGVTSAVEEDRERQPLLDEH